MSDREQFGMHNRLSAVLDEIDFKFDDLEIRIHELASKLNGMN